MYLQGVDSVYDLVWSRWEEADGRADGHLRRRLQGERARVQPLQLRGRRRRACCYRHFREYEAEAERCLAAGLPVPAYDYVLKCSHTFNLLDARGVISVTDRTAYIARVRDLARKVAELYLEVQAERPGRGGPEAAGDAEPPDGWRGMSAETLLSRSAARSCRTSLRVGAAPARGRRRRDGLVQTPARRGTACCRRDLESATTVRVLVSPRRIAVLVRGVPDRQEPETQRSRGPRVVGGLRPDGAPTKAGEGFARGRGLAVAEPAAARPSTASSSCPPRSSAARPDARRAAGSRARARRRPPGAARHALGAASGGRRRLPALLAAPPLARRQARRRTVATPLLRPGAGERTAATACWARRSTSTRRGTTSEHLEEQCVIVDQASAAGVIVAGLDAAARRPAAALVRPRRRARRGRLPGRVAERARAARSTSATCACRATCSSPPCRATSATSRCETAGGRRCCRPSSTCATPTRRRRPLITHGNERVLDGRLDDAEFAYDRDLAEGLEAMAGGSARSSSTRSSARWPTRRARLEAGGRLAAGTAARGDAGAGGVDAADRTAPCDACRRGERQRLLARRPLARLRRAAALAKADLVSLVVQEFPSLQGTMGEHLRARRRPARGGRRAIGEHYLPLSATAPRAARRSPAPARRRREDRQHRRRLGRRREAERLARPLRPAPRGDGHRAHRARSTACASPARAAGQALDRTRRRARRARRRGARRDRRRDAGLRARAPAGAAARRGPAVRRRRGGARRAPPATCPRSPPAARAFAALAGRDILDDVVTAYDRCASLAGKARRRRGASGARPALFRDEAERVLAAALADAAPGVLDALGHLEIESALAAAAPCARRSTATSTTSSSWTTSRCATTGWRSSPP